MSTITKEGDQVLVTYTAEELAAMETARNKPTPRAPEKRPVRPRRRIGPVGPSGS